MSMRYADKSFVELMEWLYVWYVQIMPRGLKRNQYKMQVKYNAEYPIETFFDQMEMGQEFTIAIN